MIEQFLKFCIVGGSGVFVDFGITYLCTVSYTHLTLPTT